MVPQEEQTEIRRARGPRRIIQAIAGAAGGHIGLVCVVVAITQRHSALTTSKFDGHIQKRLIC